MRDRAEDIERAIEYARSISDQDFEYDEEAVRAALTQRTTDSSGLAIKILSVLGGMIATLAFMGFLVLANLYESKAGLLVIGTLCVTGAIMLNKVYRQLIVDTFSVCLYISGYILLAMGLGLTRVDEQVIPLLFMVLAVLTGRIAFQSYVLSFLAVLIFNGSWLALISIWESFDWIHFYIIVNAVILTYWLMNESKIIVNGRIFSSIYNPVRAGLMVSLLAGLICVGKKDLFPINTDLIGLSSIALWVLIPYVVSKILAVMEVEKQKIKWITITVLLLTPTIFAPAISGAALILLLTFYVGHRTGIALGSLAMVYFVAQYYYDLNFTLLQKSILLMISGVLFTIAYWVMFGKSKSHEEV